MVFLNAIGIRIGRIRPLFRVETSNFPDTTFAIRRDGLFVRRQIVHPFRSIVSRPRTLDGV
jgi:hypothetical protein